MSMWRWPNPSSPASGHGHSGRGGCRRPPTPTVSAFNRERATPIYMQLPSCAAFSPFGLSYLRPCSPVETLAAATPFGERETMERRGRLRALVVRLEADGQVDRLLRAQEDDQAARAGEEEEEAEQIQYPFFTEGYSLPRAKARIERDKRRHNDPNEDPKAEADLVVKRAGEFVLDCSENGDDRPLTGCSFSRDASLHATR